MRGFSQPIRLCYLTLSSNQRWVPAWNIIASAIIYYIKQCDQSSSTSLQAVSSSLQTVLQQLSSSLQAFFRPTVFIAFQAVFLPVLLETDYVTIHPWSLYCAGEAVSRRRLAHQARGWLRPGPVCARLRPSVMQRSPGRPHCPASDHIASDQCQCISGDHSCVSGGSWGSPRPVSRVSGTSSHIRHAMDDKEYFRRQDKSFKHYTF